MIKAVLFDLDGTLVNSITDLTNSTNYAISVCGAGPHSEEAYKYFVGNGITIMIRRALGEKYTEENLKICRERFFEHYNIHYADNTCVYAGMPQLVNKLNGRGIKTAVVTNKAEPAAKEVVNRLYGNVFNLVFGQREGIPTKPDPTLTLLAMEELGVKPEECIFIGDSGMDVATGVNSGAVPVGVLWGFRKSEELLEHGAKYLISKPEELFDIILKVNNEADI